MDTNGNSKISAALCIIATNKYIQFVEQLLNSARKYFLLSESVTFYIFTDAYRDFGEDCVIIPTKHEPWPGPTLHRYRTILSVKSMFRNNHYIFYIDADMLFVDTVGREILGNDLTAILHPGFAMFQYTGSWENNKMSTAYTEKRTKYFCGGFQGGERLAYLRASEIMNDHIKDDEGKHIIAKYHDESHWNCLLSRLNIVPYLILNPSYCMPEEASKRKLWKIDHLKPKIIALAKDHQKLRT